MKVVLELHEAFRIHYELDKFEDSMERIYDDVKEQYDTDKSASWMYELELLEEFKHAFPKSYEIETDKIGRWITTGNPNFSPFDCSEEHISICSICGYEIEQDGFNYCPNCGAKMEEEK